MRKLLNKTDKDLANWLRKTITNNRHEAEFLFKASSDTILNTLYRVKLEKHLPKVLSDNGDTLDLATGNLAISAAVVDKSRHALAIESASADLKENEVYYRVYYTHLPYLKTYIMVHDLNEQREYDIFGLNSVGYFQNEDIEQFINMLEA
jgi:hypothetical protein